MTNDTQFKVWRVEEQEGDYRGSERTLDIKELPAGDVLIKVSHSSLNYKDALSASGNKGVTRSFPHTPGIDAAGEVIESAMIYGTAGLTAGLCVQKILTMGSQARTG